ncbi:carboxypeptidase regulatory-like domain-containing protein [Gimesia sp.]|uniref:carboxypeptidase regulatory-like domain-containing protein n=1 Tax=Gimesia sp. TaxID=2024833 RepID=UPI003A901871
MMTKRCCKLLFCLTLSFILTACGGAPDDQPKLAPVSGTITMDGAPLSGAFVRFYPTSGRASAGKTDEEGKYELVFIRDEKGAILGKHTVKISTLDEDNDPFGNQGSETVPDKFNKKTTLEATVVEGDNTVDFELTK